MAQWRWFALVGLLGGLCGCGVRGNPRPPLPEVHPLGTLPDGGTAGESARDGGGLASPDAGR